MSSTNGSGAFERDEFPKAFKYRDRLAAVEEMIVDALPYIIAKLVSMAKEGDIAASRYLIDRIYGRVARTPVPPSADKDLPYNGLDFSLASLRHKDERDSKVQAYMRSIHTRDAATIPGVKPPRDTNPSLDQIRAEMSRKNGH